MAETLEDEVDVPEPDKDWAEEEFDESADLSNVNDSDTPDDDDNGEAAGGEDGDGDREALDELEAEELEMLTEDEAAETLPVDEAEELREIRRAAMSLESAADSAAEGEFVCASCFLVKAGSQLADKRKKLCRDCA